MPTCIDVRSKCQHLCDRRNSLWLRDNLAIPIPGTASAELTIDTSTVTRSWPSSVWYHSQHDVGMKLAAEILGFIFVRSVMIIGCLTNWYLCLTNSLAPAYLTMSIATLSIRPCLFTIIKPHITFMFGNPQFSSIYIDTRGRLRL